MATLIGSVNGGRDIDTEAEIFFAHGLHKIFRLYAVVENSGDRGDMRQTLNDRIEIGGHIAAPMRGRRHILARTQSAAIPGIAKIHRTEGGGEPQELAQLLEGALVVLALAGDRENNEIVLKRGSRTESMQ